MPRHCVANDSQKQDCSEIRRQVRLQIIINIKSADKANAVISTDGKYQEKNNMQPGKAVAGFKEFKVDSLALSEPVGFNKKRFRWRTAQAGVRSRKHLPQSGHHRALPDLLLPSGRRYSR